MDSSSVNSSRMSKSSDEPTIKFIYVDDYEDRHGERSRDRAHPVAETKGSRIVTIAYQWYRDKKGHNLKYAASVFRKDIPENSAQKDDKDAWRKETFVKKHHRQTAQERLKLRPLWTFFACTNDTKYQDLRNHLRHQVHRNGTGDKRRMRRFELARKKVHSKHDEDIVQSSNTIIMDRNGNLEVGGMQVKMDDLRQMLIDMGLRKKKTQSARSMADVQSTLAPIG